MSNSHPLKPVTEDVSLMPICTPPSHDIAEEIDTATWHGFTVGPMETVAAWIFRCHMPSGGCVVVLKLKGRWAAAACLGFALANSGVAFAAAPAPAVASSP